jgi:hypothetical protein
MAVIAGLLSGVVYAKPLLRPETGSGQTLRYVGAPRVAITYHTGFFTTCYGPEFVAKDVRAWIGAVGAQTAFIEPGSPWENGYIESFNARFRDERLNREIFYSLREAQITIEGWRKHYNTKRPHSALEYRPPAPETMVTPSGSAGSAPLRRLTRLVGEPTMH